MLNTKLLTIPDFVFVGLVAIIFHVLIAHFMGGHLNNTTQNQGG